MFEQQHVTSSYHEKKKVLAAVDCKQRRKNIANESGISPSTMPTITPTENCKRGVKRNRRGEYPGVEAALLLWYNQCRQKNIYVGSKIIREKAKTIAAAQRIKGFKGSIGWVDRFKKRHGILFGKRPAANISNVDIL